MHGAPRFGQSNHIGSLASRDRDVQFEYANGVSAYYWTGSLVSFGVVKK